MPNLTGLAALFRLRPDRAADYLAAKGFRLSGPYWEMDGPQHSHLFTVANLAKLDVLQDIRSAVQQALDEGQTQRWFEKQLIDTLKAKGWWGGKDGSLRRLQTIYRTNLQTAYMAGRHQQALEQADRRPWAQYLAVRDHRSRPAHAALHGQVFRIDSPAWAAISPPNGYNSLLPWQQVSGHSFVGLKAWYAGPAVEILGKSGSRLAVTAQHPVLTVNGWVAAGDLRQGDQLIGYRSDISSGPVSADLHIDNPPPTIEEVFNTLSLGGSCTLPRAAVNLYGDVVFINGDVDVVTADSQLLRHFETVRQEFLAKLGFHHPNETEISLSSRGAIVQVVGGQGDSRASLGGPLSLSLGAETTGDSLCPVNDDAGIAQLAANPFSASAEHSPNLFDTDPRLIQGNSLRWEGAFEMRLIAQSELNAGKFMGLRHGALGYAPLADIFIGGFSVNPSAHCDIMEAQAGLIEIDDIVDLRFFDYTGHVYDLETATGNIIAYGGINTPHIIVSNCRCRARYLSDEDLKKRGLKPAEDIQILEREPPGKMPVNPMTGDTPQRWIQRGVSVPSKTKPGERDILWADPGWDNIPGSDGAERMLVDRLMAKATDLGDGVRMAVQKAIKEVAQQVEKAAPTWTMLKAEQAQLDEIKRLGGERLQELLDLVTPDDRQMFPAMGDRGIRVEELISRGGITNPFINWLRAEMMTRLKGVRPVGGKAFNLVNKSGKAVELSNRVASKLPDTWVEKVNAAGNPYKVTVAENSRGCHWGGLRQIRTNSGSTAEHEWAHAVQSADPILDKLFKDEHQRRTVNEALEWLGGNYKKDELTRKDGYINAYQGKEYQEGGALEVITMAMQTILGEDYSANNMLAAMLKRDREMLRLTLGVLFHYLP